MAKRRNILPPKPPCLSPSPPMPSPKPFQNSILPFIITITAGLHRAALRQRFRPTADPTRRSRRRLPFHGPVAVREAVHHLPLSGGTARHDARLLFRRRRGAGKSSRPSKGENEAFNIGTGIATHTEDLFTAILRCGQGCATRHSEKLRFPGKGPARPGDLSRSCLIIEKAATPLGFSPAFLSGRRIWQRRLNGN